MEFKDRLKAARRDAGLTQMQLAEKVGINQSVVSSLERGVHRGSSHAVDIATALGVSPRWLSTGEGEIRPSSVSQHPALFDSNVAAAPRMDGYVPVISWVQAGAWTEVGNVEPVSDEMVPRPPGSSDRTFALRVKGQSMSPRYEPNLIIYVDPEVVPFDGDDVVAVLTESNEATFKQYVEEPGGGRLLKARNPSWPEQWVPINGNCQIIGVVIATMWMRTPKAG